MDGAAGGEVLEAADRKRTGYGANPSVYSTLNITEYKLKVFAHY